MSTRSHSSRNNYSQTLVFAEFASMERLYEDEFVMLTPAKLVLKNFRFPNKKCKIITIDSIGILWFEHQDTCKPKTVKTWGKSQPGVYWALDVKRCMPGSHRLNVVVDLGNMRCGFSVENGTAFMEAMRDILDYHVIVVDKINL